MDLSTQRYINVNELKSELSKRQDDIERVLKNISHMRNVIKTADEAGQEKVVQAGEESINDFAFERQEYLDDLAKLTDLLSDIETYNCLEDPEVVNEDHFETHLREQSMDIHGVDIDAFPFCYIDWDKAREALMEQDYASIEFAGDTFWVKVA